ncbi:AbrB family transcriptional regulator [Limosilactobacillus pontis]
MKLPTALDWADLVKQIPVENIEIDEHGYYDPKAHPDFHDWMVNG